MNEICFESRRQFEKLIDQIYFHATKRKITSWNHTPGTSVTIVLNRSIMALSLNGKQLEIQICPAKDYRPNIPPILSYKLKSEGYSYLWILCNPETQQESDYSEAIDWPPKRNTAKSLARFLFSQLQDHITANKAPTPDYWHFRREDFEDDLAS